MNKDDEDLGTMIILFSESSSFIWVRTMAMTLFKGTLTANIKSTCIVKMPFEKPWSTCSVPRQCLA